LDFLGNRLVSGSKRGLLTIVLMDMVSTAWERLLSRFIDVSATLRLREPASSTAHASDGDSTVSSVRSSTKTPSLEFSRS